MMWEALQEVYKEVAMIEVVALVLLFSSKEHFHRLLQEEVLMQVG